MINKSVNFIVQIRQKLSPTVRYIITLVLTVIITFLICHYIVGFAFVDGESMEPTFSSGNLIIVDKITNKIDRFDVIIFNSSDGLLIKRVIGMPGETVQIKRGQVYINNEPIKDIVTCETDFTGIAFEPLEIGEEEYFVLGDNRPNSKDSRFDDVGMVSQEQIVGRVVFSLIPLKFLK